MANIGNVPAGATPTLSPADGRLAIAGDQASGWKVVVGLSAASAGTIALSVSAAGATGASAPVTVSAAGISYLPATSASPAAVYAMRKVTPAATYSGPLFRLALSTYAAGTPATYMDVTAKADGTPDDAAVDAWAGSAVVRVAIRYDQSGNGRHETQGSFALMPLYPTAGQALTSPATFTAGQRPMIHDGSPGGTLVRYLSIPAVAGLDRGNFSVYMANVQKTADGKDAFFSLQDSAGTADLAQLYIQQGGLFSSIGTAAAAKNTYMRQRLQSLAYSNTAVNEIVYHEGVKKTFAARTSASMAFGGRDGGVITANYAAAHDNWLTILFATALSDADVASLDSWAAGALPYPTAPITQQILYAGSSLIAGFGCTGGIVPSQILGYGDGTEIYNLGRSGRALSAEYAGRAAYFALRRAGVPSVYIMDAPSNDISSNTFADAAAAQTFADNLYENTTKAYKTAAIAAGFKAVVVPTVIARSGFNTTGNFFETARLRYNQNVVNGAAANGYVVADRAGDARLSNVDDAAYFYADKVHLNNAGTAVLRNIDKAAFDAAFAA